MQIYETNYAHSLTASVGISRKKKAPKIQNGYFPFQSEMETTFNGSILIFYLTLLFLKFARLVVTAD